MVGCVVVVSSDSQIDGVVVPCLIQTSVVWVFLVYRLGSIVVYMRGIRGTRWDVLAPPGASLYVQNRPIFVN